MISHMCPKTACIVPVSFPPSHCDICAVLGPGTGVSPNGGQSGHPDAWDPECRRCPNFRPLHGRILLSMGGVNRMFNPKIT